MTEKYMIFKYMPRENVNIKDESMSNYKLEKIKPSLRMWLKKEVALIDLLWKELTFGNYTLYCLKDENDNIIHKSTRIGRCFKFPFMSKNEYEIGPCYTIEEQRGRGIYPFVISTIISENPKYSYYMIISELNKSSIKGVKKAGFIKIGWVERRPCGIWKII